MQTFSDSLENTVEKGENAGFQHFFSFYRESGLPQDTSEPLTSTYETHEIFEHVSCLSDVTEIMLKVA